MGLGLEARLDTSVASDVVGEVELAGYVKCAIRPGPFDPVLLGLDVGTCVGGVDIGLGFKAFGSEVWGEREVCELGLE